MTIGIYILYWEEDNLIYVGQSANIEIRYYKHTWMLKNNRHDNYKIQNNYNKYGSYPLLKIVEKCVNTDNLDILENSWIEEFDSTSIGLNLCAAEGVRYGTNATNTKYSKIKLLLVFRALRNYKISYDSLAKKHDINASTIRSIAMGVQHTWLHVKYPNIWKQIQEVSSKKLSYKNSLVNLGKPTKYVVSPSGEEYLVENLSEFSRQHGLWTSSLCRLLKGQIKSTNGWVLKNELD